MRDFEQELGQLLGDDHDFDKTVLDPETTAKFLAILAQMSDYRIARAQEFLNHAAWDAESETYADILVDDWGYGYSAFTGTENFFAEGEA